jgi:hypothetical protein
MLLMVQQFSWVFRTVQGHNYRSQIMGPRFVSQADHFKSRHTQRRFRVKELMAHLAVEFSGGLLTVCGF